MSRERRIDYVEFASTDPAASRAFFEKAFGWSFVDYGSDYTAFDDGRLQGGFFRGQPLRASDAGAPLLVLYADQLAPIETAVLDAGGEIVRRCFPSPAAAVSSSSSPVATNWRCGPNAIRPERRPSRNI